MTISADLLDHLRRTGCTLVVSYDHLPRCYELVLRRREEMIRQLIDVRDVDLARADVPGFVLEKMFKALGCQAEPSAPITEEAKNAVRDIFSATRAAFRDSFKHP
jgi:hypothetical protein